MKELIGKLSRGIIDYNIPVIETSVTSIEMSVEEASVNRGSFELFYNDNNEESPYIIKGIVYSTNDSFKIINNQFQGQRCKIQYEVDAKSFQEGMEISGRVNVVSNAGEVYIPYTVKIASKSINSSIGEISNIFSFIDLVKREYDEALKLFISPQFRHVILKNDIGALSMYDGLSKSYDKKRALEEFLIGINKKQPVSYSISDDNKHYDQLTESYKDVLVLTRNTWGYQRIDVEIDGDFITDCKPYISNEDFAGNNYEYSYLLDIEKLHLGMNYARIVFKTISQRLECNISVNNIKEHDESHREVNKCLVDLTENYLNFRMRKNGIDNWAEKSLSLIERARGYDDSKPFLKLLQAQMCVSKKRDEEAEWLLDSVAEEILDKKEENVELYCYYLYVRTLQKRELEHTLEALRIIKKYYENGYDSWKILWVLMYIDSSFENNKSLKLTRIKEQFKIGCNSPLMYYEALYVLNKQPALLRVINNFELQVLCFGIKYDAIDLRLAIQISELAMLEKSYRPLLFRILVNLYNKFENKVILTALISILIRGNQRDKKFFKWYELGIAADLKVTSLYEYYVFSMPEDYNAPIPNMVLMYYIYNGNLLNEKEAFYYSKIIEFKDRYPSVYKNYKKTLEHFAVTELRNGTMNQYMSVIYNDILTTSMVTEENVNMLPKVLNTWKVTCKNPKLLKVIVIHKEINKEEEYSLVKGNAYITIYTEDAIVLFEDAKSNRYMCSVDYQLDRMFTNTELSDISILRNSENIYIMAQTCEQSLEYHKNIKSGIQVFRNIMEGNYFSHEYCNYILKDIIEYYTNNYDGEDLDNYLISIEVDRLTLEIRNKVIDLMIMRGLYNEAGKIISEYGICNVDPRRILKFSTYLLKDNMYNENKDILNYCSYSFRNGKYNEISLDYLCRYYNGTTKEMMELWRISKEFSYESRDLEERIIAQMLFTRSHMGSIVTIYESYYKKGTLEILKYAYLFFEAYEYFVKEKPIDDLYFIHLESELDNNDALMDVCKCAFLLYCSQKEKLSNHQEEICKKLVLYLSKKNIVFNFYREYAKWFSIPGDIVDKTTIEYRTNPKDKILIHYIMETGEEKEGSYEVDEMNCIFKGLYTKSFSIFYGENINYYITEENSNKIMLTQSSKYSLDDTSVQVDSSRFGIINDILVCSEMKDEGMVLELAKKYYIDTVLAQDLFK